ncbi:hypothetical protein [Kitasatospora sp. NPDC094015]|uniref:hypothetical protein n=1 Tax=Kitasatospora sp. NPDC094015 TaxID=3155205 RepID=UPI0033174217
MPGPPPRAGAPARPATGPPGGAPDPATGTPPADPVRELIARHRAVCEQAVDPLEIAAALEDAGIGAGTAGHYRHADVFGLAEELYARVPRRPPEPAPAERPAPWARSWGRATGAAVRHGLPAALLLLVGSALPGLGRPVALALLLLAAVPLSRSAPAGSRAVRCGYGLGIALLLAPTVTGAGGADALLAAVAVLALGSAAWSADWLRRTGRGHLGSARTMAEFRGRMRPVLPVAVLLHLAVLAVLTFGALAAASALAPGPGPAGGLLHGAAHRAGATQWAAQAAVALLLVLATALLRGEHPAPAAVALPVAGVAALLLTGAFPAAAARLAACGTVGLLLLPYAWVASGRPGSYRPGPPGRATGPRPHGRGPRETARGVRAPGFREGHPR